MHGVNARLFPSLLLLPLLCCACVERELVVQTEPSGARVYVDGVDRGVSTPDGLRIPFEYYGTREVVVRLAGMSRPGASSSSRRPGGRPSRSGSPPTCSGRARFGTSIR